MEIASIASNAPASAGAQIVLRAFDGATRSLKRTTAVLHANDLSHRAIMVADGAISTVKNAATREPRRRTGNARFAELSELPRGEAIPSMTLLEQYIAGWRAHDSAAILATLTPDCVVIESFGPIYRGHDWVARWVSTWLAEDGQVIDWTIRDLRFSPESEIAEWTFHYRWRGEEKSFDGATIAKLRDGKLSYLREYATTADLYDWGGKFK